jgi:hypothetical protein
MNTTRCPQGHPIKSQADRTTQGYCRSCKREDDRARHRQHRAAMDAVRVLEAAGFRFDVGMPHR